MTSAMLGLLLLSTMVGTVGATDDAVPVAQDREDCASVPCGPIPVIIVIKVTESRGLEFGDEPTKVIPGQVCYSFDVEQDGYGYNPDQLPEIQFRVPRGVPWVSVDVSPNSLGVPVEDLTHAKQDDPEGDPAQVSWEFCSNLEVTLTKEREPTAEELDDYLRSDGQYRILLAASSNGSMIDAGGAPVGLMEGYGVREFRITPATPAADALEVGDEGAEAPGPGIALLALALIVAILVTARRRD